MKLSKIAAFFRRPAAPNRRLSFAQWPAAVYAIGDVHGCYRELAALEAVIAADAASVPGEAWVVMLGDYVDRGPDSATVLDHMLKPSRIGQRFTLMGNHEAMMLQYLASPSQFHPWLANGGAETLASYGAGQQAGEPVVPAAHAALLQSMPHTLSLPGVVFVHAGIQPGLPLSEQVEEDLLWIREPFLSARNLLPRVVHGHTPSAEPVITGSRICVDTGAFGSGILSAVRVMEHGAVRFLNSQGAVADVDWPHQLVPNA